MAEVAKANDVLFVDLFTVSQRLYAEAAKQGQSLTFNTFLLTEAGNQALAPEIFKALFNEPAPKDHFEKLRAAVTDKCNESDCQIGKHTSELQSQMYIVCRLMI